MTSRPTRQRGATLLISLIMLLLVTLLTVASFKLSKGNMQIVGNTQQRSQAMTAAQAAIEQTISSPQFATTPTDAILFPCVVGTTRTPNTLCVDVNGSGVTGVIAVVSPSCVRTQIIPLTSLNFTNPDDLGCTLGANQNFGVAGVTNNNSLCADALWDIQSAATDVVSNAQFSINQGVTLREPATTACP